MITKKQKFPIQIFFFFEKINPGFFTSKILRANTFFILMPGAANFALAVFLKNELFFSSSYVVDASCVDTEFFQKNSPAKQSPLVFYTFYFFFLKIRLISCFFKAQAVFSVDSVYQSANWLEREFSEMFGINFFFKVDARNLLLDYSQHEAPLLKKFPSIGFKEVHYSILAESVVYKNTAAVEL